MRFAPPNQNFGNPQFGVVNAPGNLPIIGQFGTGAGLWSKPLADGAVVTAADLSAPVLPVRLEIDGKPAELLYAGPAPGLVAGVLQVNGRVPASAGIGDLAVRQIVGSHASSGLATVAVA